MDANEACSDTIGKVKQKWLTETGNISHKYVANSPLLTHLESGERIRFLQYTQEPVSIDGEEYRPGGPPGHQNAGVTYGWLLVSNAVIRLVIPNQKQNTDRIFDIEYETIANMREMTPGFLGRQYLEIETTDGTTHAFKPNEKQVSEIEQLLRFVADRQSNLDERDDHLAGVERAISAAHAAVETDEYRTAVARFTDALDHLEQTLFQAGTDLDISRVDTTDGWSAESETAAGTRVISRVVETLTAHGEMPSGVRTLDDITTHLVTRRRAAGDSLIETRLEEAADALERGEHDAAMDTYEELEETITSVASVIGDDAATTHRRTARLGRLRAAVEGGANQRATELITTQLLPGNEDAIVEVLRSTADAAPDAIDAVTRSLCAALDTNRRSASLGYILAELLETHSVAIDTSAVIGLLGSTDPELREHACIILAEVGGPNALEAVRDLQDDPEYDVRVAALRATQAIAHREERPLHADEETQIKQLNQITIEHAEGDVVGGDQVDQRTIASDFVANRSDIGPGVSDSAANTSGSEADSTSTPDHAGADDGDDSGGAAPDVLFCPDCGADLSAYEHPSFCIECGKQL